MTQGFPAVPFFVDRDLSRLDGVISCKRVDTVDILKAGWRFARALRILLNFPWPL